ncbi:hypothetical protein NDI49_34140, partial [Trichocoleus sp. ST-U3]
MAVSIAIAFNRDLLPSVCICVKVGKSCRSFWLITIFKAMNLPTTQVYPVIWHEGRVLLIDQNRLP